MVSIWETKLNINILLHKLLVKISEEAFNIINLALNNKSEIRNFFSSQEQEKKFFQNPEIIRNYLVIHAANLMRHNWSDMDKIIKIYELLKNLHWEIEETKNIENQTLIILVNKYKKDLVNLLVDSFRVNNSTEKQYLNRSLYDSFCQILPEIEIEPERVVTLLDEVDTNFNKLSYQIYKAIEEFAAREKSIAETLYNLLMSRANKPFVTLLNSVLLAISRTDFLKAHQEALILSNREELILRQIGISTLGNLDYGKDETQELLSLTLNQLNILRNTLDTEINFNLIRSYENLVKYTDKVQKFFLEFVVDSNPKIWKSALSSLYQLTRDESDKEWYQKALVELTKVQNLTQDELITLDFCISKYIKAKPYFALGLIEAVAKNWNFNDAEDNQGLIKGLNQTIIELSNSRLESLSYFFTKWIASKSIKLHLLAFELNKHFLLIPVRVGDTLETSKNPLLELSKEVLDSLDETTTIYVLLRIAGYEINTFSLCKLLLSALNRDSIEEKVVNIVIELLVEYVLFNYPREATEYLNNRKQAESITDLEIQVIEKSLSSSQEYLENRNKLPALKEFQASTQQAYLYRLAKWKQQNELKEAGEKQSIFRQLMPEVLFLYGKQLCSEYKGEIPKPTPMIPLSASYEIPNGELIDPLGQTWRRMKWRQVGLESTEEQSEQH